MNPAKFKEEHLTESVMIPYSMILEALKSGWQVCREREKCEPNKIILFFSSVDRKAREKNESTFLDEITRDIIYLKNKNSEEKDSSRIQVEIQTEEKLIKGKIRVEFFIDTRLLYRFEQEKNITYGVDTNGRIEEWKTVDIIPQEDSEDKIVLVVDDEPALCTVLGRMLSKLGYNAVCAHDGVEAIEILNNMNFDLVITDLRMPKMDGWALMKYVKKEIPELPVVLITGYHSMHTEVKASKSSADGYISKPFSIVEIKKLLENILKEKLDINAIDMYSSNF